MSKITFEERSQSHLRWILRPTQCVTTVVPTASRERIVAALKLAGDLLVGGSASRNEHHVKAREAEDGNREDGNQRHQAHRHDRLSLAQLVSAVEHVQEGEGEYAQHVDRERDEEEEEESVVSATDAVGNPRAVMIECLCARERK
jgi:hypothetical protein